MENDMVVAIAPLTMKPPQLDGLSQKLLESHYENNYGGAVRRLNAIEANLQALDWPSAAGFEINGLKREQLLAAGSVVLHEVYFDSLGGSGGQPSCAELRCALEANFGSVAQWRAEFIAMAKALAGGSGWVVLTWSNRLGGLQNQSAGDHAQGLAGGQPILALDMYEHAYHIDFGSNAEEYVETFMRNIDWDHVAARFRRAVGAETPEQKPPAFEITVAALQKSLNAPNNAPIVLDVRRRQDRARDILPDTPWHDMEQVDDWSGQLPRERQIVVYCMYGFWVSQDTAQALRERGFDARILQGGISAWRAMGYPTQPL
jgi:Fe-Mn family superoxide dismutase